MRYEQYNTYFIKLIRPWPTLKVLLFYISYYKNSYKSLKKKYVIFSVKKYRNINYFKRNKQILHFHFTTVIIKKWHISNFEE